MLHDAYPPAGPPLSTFPHCLPTHALHGPYLDLIEMFLFSDYYILAEVYTHPSTQYGQ